MANRFPDDPRAKRTRADNRKTGKLTAHRGLATWGEKLKAMAEPDTGSADGDEGTKIREE